MKALSDEDYWQMEWLMLGVRQRLRIQALLRHGLSVDRPEDAGLALWMAHRERKMALFERTAVPLTLASVAVWVFLLEVDRPVTLWLVLLSLVGALVSVVNLGLRLRNIRRAERSNRLIYEKMGEEFYKRVREGRLEGRPLPHTPE